MEVTQTQRFAALGSRYYGVLLAIMAVVVVLSGIGAVKGVQFGPILTDGGFFLFPIAYILGDVLSEVYGFAAARKAILTTFAMSAFASVCYWIIIILPSFDDNFGRQKQEALETVLGPVPQLVAGSLLAFLAGQLINSQIVVRLKARQGEQRLWLRLLGSSGLGQFVDTFIFCVIAAPVIGITSVAGFLNYFLVGFFYKVILQYALIPITSMFIGWVKRHEPSY